MFFVFWAEIRTKTIIQSNKTPITLNNIIEILDAADVYAGRKLRPSQRIKLKLPSMDFAVDAVIADVGSIAEYKAGADGGGSITLYDKSYTGKK